MRRPNTHYYVRLVPIFDTLVRYKLILENNFLQIVVLKSQATQVIV